MARLGRRTRHPQDAHMWRACRLPVCYERPCRYATGKRKNSRRLMSPPAGEGSVPGRPSTLEGAGDGLQTKVAARLADVRKRSAQAQWRSTSEVALGSTQADRLS